MADNKLLQQLEGIESRFREVATLITDPAVIADMQRYVRLTKEYKELERLTEATRRYRTLLDRADEARAILADESDPEMRQMAQEQLDSANEALPGTEDEIRLLLIPADPEDSKNAILEIRGGTGGDEAALFAGDLCKMYIRFCESRGWNVAVTSASEGAAGGFKEVVLAISGDGVYGVLKYESGVHRVQRVPATETQGRVHTSAATVAVLPEAEPFDVQIQGGKRGATALHVAQPEHRSERGNTHRVHRNPRPAQKQGTRPEPPAHFHLRQGTPEIRGRHSLAAQDNGFHRRPLGENTHLQLPPGTNNRPPHKLHGL